MSDIDEIMDFEYHSDAKDDETYLKLSKKHKRSYYESGESREKYTKKQRTTANENRDAYPVQKIVLPCVENWDEIETLDNETTEAKKKHTLPNLVDNREEKGKKIEKTDQKDKSRQKNLKGRIQYSRSMRTNNRVLAVVPEISKNGWVLFVNALNEEASEVEVRNLFADYGEICDIRLNLCRRTGFVMGYALIQYNSYADALKAKEALHNTDFLGRKISVDWCFLKSPKN